MNKKFYLYIQMRLRNNKAPLAAYTSIFIIITFCLAYIYTVGTRTQTAARQMSIHSSTWVRMWLARITNWTFKAFIILTNYTYRRKVFLLLTTESFHLPPYVSYIREKCLLWLYATFILQLKLEIRVALKDLRIYIDITHLKIILYLTPARTKPLRSGIVLLYGVYRLSSQ